MSVSETAKTAGSDDSLEIRLLRVDEISQIDSVFRQGFGSYFEMPDPEQFAPGRSCMTRMVVQPDGAFGAYAGGKLVGIACNSIHGSIGIFGPLSVLPPYWGKGVAKRLLTKSLSFFVSEGISSSVLTTFPDSGKHIFLYKKFGFQPQHLITMLSKSVAGDGEAACGIDDVHLFSKLDHGSKLVFLKKAKRLTNDIYTGLDLNKEIEAVDGQGIGDTILLERDGQLRGFAIFHAGMNSETEGNVFYIKFAAVDPGRHARSDFKELIAICERTASAKNLGVVFCGVNTARQTAFEDMLAAGYMIDSTGIAMVMSNQPTYNRNDVFVLDDWR
ncbi:MAG TPA: GNAT family N-acetyltransferase [Oculatellaceae cyanobacterium]